MDKKRVLIVDDEIHIRTSLSVLTKELHIEPTCAKNGAEAFDLLLESQYTNNEFDLLICDLQMPVLTGEELIQKMLHQKMATPILVITGIGDKELVIKLMRIGIKDFIDKPFSPDEIQERISTLLEKADSEKIEQQRNAYFARIGEVAYTSAHEINNALGATIGYADMLLEGIHKDHRMYNGLSRISSTAKRTAEICQEILSIPVSQSQFFKVNTDLNVLIEKIAVLLDDVLPENITVTTKRRTTPLWYRADAQQIQHAILNLGFNGAAAMPDGGELQLLLDSKSIHDSLFVCITVGDTGEGMPEEIIENIFNNGLSIGKGGQDIGLANVKNIIEAHDGHIDVQSVKGQGTCITVLLPLNHT